MLGAIAGDIIGSALEWSGIPRPDFPLFTPLSSITDDTVMTLAVADALLKCDGNCATLRQACIASMQELGRAYPGAGYGPGFYHWLFTANPRPYQSFGNGSAMRVSACAYAAADENELKQLAHDSACISHDHPEGLKGAEAAALAVFLARNGADKGEIRNRLSAYYDLNFTIDGIRGTYRPNASCQGTVPQSIEAFLEAESFEQAVRLVISLGGDTDTMGAITGAIAEAYFGMPQEIRTTAESYLDLRLLSILKRFEDDYPPPVRS